MDERTERLMTAKEVADRLRISTSSIYRYIREGALRSLKIRKQYRIRQSDYDSFVGDLHQAGVGD